jgi:hypothetical protein
MRVDNFPLGECADARGKLGTATVVNFPFASSRLVEREETAASPATRTLSVTRRCCRGREGQAYASAPSLSTIAEISSLARSNSSSESTGVPSNGRSRVISSQERQPP